MAKLIADMSMSLDGFVADENDGVDKVFARRSMGPETVSTASDVEMQMTEETRERFIRAPRESAQRHGPPHERRRTATDTVCRTPSPSGIRRTCRWPWSAGRAMSIRRCPVRRMSRGAQGELP